MTNPLPGAIIPLSLDDIYAIYCDGVAYGMRQPIGDPRAPLMPLLITLRTLWFDAHMGELFSEQKDAPAWLAAQQTLKERSV